MSDVGWVRKEKVRGHEKSPIIKELRDHQIDRQGRFWVGGFSPKQYISIHSEKDELYAVKIISKTHLKKKPFL